MQEVNDIIGPLAVCFLMAVVGLELTVEDFRRIGRMPRAAIIGTLGQISLLPAFTWAVAIAFELPAATAGGLVLLAACPGGGMSNILVHFAGANLALSVTLTGLTSILAVVSLPLLLDFGLDFLVQERGTFVLPVRELFGQLVFMVLLPIVVGMVMRAHAPEWVARNHKRLSRLGLLGLGVVVTLAFLSDSELVADSMDGVIAPAFFWTAGAAALGYGLGWVLRLDVRDRFALMVEYATRNFAVAAVVTLGSLERPDFLGILTAVLGVGYAMMFVLSGAHRRLVRVS